MKMKVTFNQKIYTYISEADGNDLDDAANDEIGANSKYFHADNEKDGDDQQNYLLV